MMIIAKKYRIDISTERTPKRCCFLFATIQKDFLSCTPCTPFLFCACSSVFIKVILRCLVPQKKKKKKITLFTKYIFLIPFEKKNCKLLKSLKHLKILARAKIKKFERLRILKINSSRHKVMQFD